ncbi:hypothetical protein pb186bvf_019886 [Paramecium bursaria]
MLYVQSIQINCIAQDITKLRILLYQPLLLITLLAIPGALLYSIIFLRGLQFFLIVVFLMNSIQSFVYLECDLQKPSSPQWQNPSTCSVSYHNCQQQLFQVDTDLFEKSKLPFLHERDTSNEELEYQNVPQQQTLLFRAIDSIIVLISQVEGSPEYYQPLYLNLFIINQYLVCSIQSRGSASIYKTKHPHSIEFINRKHKLIPTPNLINLVLIELVEQDICHSNLTHQKSG